MRGGAASESSFVPLLLLGESPLSSLTKILVILVVLLALIQTAATVVFVNRVENAGQTIGILTDTNKSLESKSAELQRSLESSEAQASVIRTNAQSQTQGAY